MSKRVQISKDNLLAIAKLIDNEYLASNETFSAERKLGYYYLSTNKCDYASFIKVYTDPIVPNKINRILVNGDYTDGWQDITDFTKERINKYLESQGLATLKTP